MLDIIFLLAFGVIFCVALIGFAWYLRQETLDRQTRRQISRTHYHYDPRGNPEYFYDDRTGEYFLPGPGNEANRPPDNIIFQPVRVEQNQSKPRPPELRSNGRPIISEVREELPQEIEAEKPLPQLPNGSRKLLLDLLQALEGGATPSNAICQITGQKGGRKYQEAARLLKLYQEGAINVDN